ncbi:hypothetical protein D3C77_559300 [compost metagenome]
MQRRCPALHDAAGAVFKVCAVSQAATDIGEGLAHPQTVAASAKRARTEGTKLFSAFPFGAGRDHKPVAPVMLSNSDPRPLAAFFAQSRDLIAFDQAPGDRLPAFQNGADHRPAEQDRAFLCFRHDFSKAAL